VRRVQENSKGGFDGEYREVGRRAMNRTFSLILCFVVAAAALSATSQHSHAQTNHKFINLNCRMNACSWMAIRDRTIIKENKDGRLIGVTTLDCTTHHPNGRYPQSYSCRPNEITEGNFVAFCSLKNPMVAFKNSESNKWIRNQLVIAQQGVVGYLISSLTSYFYACHDLAWKGENLDFIGARLGYRVQQSDGLGGQDEVESILDLIQ
jgi:hypothetical protein